MNKKAISTFATSALLLGFVAVSPAQANMGCPYGGSPNWQGVCDTTTEDGDSYFGPQVWIPEPAPVPTVEPQPTVEPTPVEESTPDIEVQEGGILNDPDTEVSANTAANPNVANNPVIWGNGNRVSSTVTNVNTTNNSVINNILNKINNSSSSFKVVQVTGGYVVIGDSGAQFLPYPSNELDLDAFDRIGESVETQYLEEDQLPIGIRRAVNRLPESASRGDSRRIPRILNGSESVTEDVCMIEKGRVNFLSRGICVLEILVDDNVYEHEIKVTR